ncbi:hypothetical protein [Aquiflexum balticum]|nr:hypothetical protein [Aquiflexum balticum]
MKIIPLGILGLIFLLNIVSCNSDPEEPMISLYGAYLLTKIETDGQFDFLNVGEATSDMKKQLEESQGVNFDNVLLTFFWGTPEVFNITFMQPSLLTTLPDNIPLIRYVNSSKTLSVEYIQESREFSIIKNYTATTEIGQVTAIELVNQFQIKVSVPQRIYDYKSQAWVNTLVTYTYNRLNV